MQLQYEAEELSDDDLDDAVMEVQRNVDAALSTQASVLAEWNKRKLWRRDGSRSATACLSRRTGLSGNDASRALLRARRLGSMPLTAERFAAGDMAFSRVDLLVRANRPEVTDQFTRDEAVILEAIEPLTFGNADKSVRYWSQHADEMRCSNRANRLLEQRSAHMSKTFENSVDLRALFDPVSGEIFSKELERLERQLFETDWATAKQTYGEDTRVEHLTRTTAQRRCDALVLMAERSASAGSGVGCRPLISVMVDYNSFEKLCETGSGTVLTPSQIVPLLATADIERIVFDGGTRFIEVSRRRRFTGALRRAIEVRDRHCQDDSGCDVPADQCEADHTNPWCRGGMTAQDNGKLMCATHNRGKGAGPP